MDGRLFKVLDCVIAESGKVSAITDIRAVFARQRNLSRKFLTELEKFRQQFLGAEWRAASISPREKRCSKSPLQSPS